MNTNTEAKGNTEVKNNSKGEVKMNNKAIVSHNNNDKSTKKGGKAMNAFDTIVVGAKMYTESKKGEIEMEKFKKINVTAGNSYEEICEIIRKWHEALMKYRCDIAEGKVELEKGTRARLEIHAKLNKKMVEKLCNFLDKDIDIAELQQADGYLLVDEDGDFVKVASKRTYCGEKNVTKYVDIDRKWKNAASYDEVKQCFIIDVGIVCRYTLIEHVMGDPYFDEINEKTYKKLYEKFIAAEEEYEDDYEDDDGPDYEGGHKLIHVGEGAYCDDDGDNWEFI